MERPTLQATKRQDTGSRVARRLRNDGLLPVVLYGHQRDTVHLTVVTRDFELMFDTGARMLDLEIGGTVETALLKDIQYDAMGDHIMHVDFNRVDLDERITVRVPVELHGTAKGVTAGGTLDHSEKELEVRCRAGSIPELIRVEIAELDINDRIHIRDLEVPEGVELLQDPDASVVAVQPPTAAEVLEPTEEPELEGEAEPEVIGGHREKEEGEDDKATKE